MLVIGDDAPVGISAPAAIAEQSFGAPPYRLAGEPGRSTTTLSVEGEVFPLAPTDLQGKPILLIAIARDAEAVVQFAAGEARWTGSELRVSHHPARPAARIAGSPATLAGYDPAILPRFIVPEHRAAVTALAATAHAWVVSFTTERLADALTLSMPFFGLAERADGAALLFEGSSDEEWLPADDDESEPGEPSRAGAQVP